MTGEAKLTAVRCTEIAASALREARVAETGREAKLFNDCAETAVIAARALELEAWLTEHLDVADGGFVDRGFKECADEALAILRGESQP